MLNKLREYAERIDLAETRDDLGKIYEDMVGYDITTEDPQSTVSELRDLCRDYLKELCYAEGIHCDDVFDPCVSDDDRSYGPWGRP